MQRSQDGWVGREAVLRVDEEGAVYLRPFIRGGGGGSAGSTRSTQQTSQTDPWLTKINELAYGQISKGVEQTGGLPAYLQPNPYALPSEEELGITRQIAAAPSGLSEMESQGLSDYERLADPTAMLTSARDIFEQTAAPMIRNDAITQGQGRQGVVPESLARGFAEIAGPIIQQSQGARQQLANRRLALGPELQGRGLEGLSRQLATAAYPREARSQEYMRPLETIAGLVGGLPVGGGTVSGYATGKTKATRGDFDVLGDLIIPLVGAIAGGAAGCWLSTAALSPGEAIKWRVYLLHAPRWERTLYRLLSHPWTKFLAPVVRPWFRGRLR